MFKYDVIIIGAGIAGCSLAYNLKRFGYNGNILVIDKECPGANADYGYRSLQKEYIEEYNLPHEHIFKGANIGFDNKVYFTLQREYYFVDYKKVCTFLLKNSDATYKKTVARKIIKNKLITNQEVYSFNYLIDCSGHSFFAKKLLNQKLPERYFVGKTKVLKNKINNPQNLFYHFNETGYVEDLYLLKDKTIHGDWQYTKKINFKEIIVPKNNLYKKYIDSPDIVKEFNSVIPVSPALPIVHKNIAFLGDSFGNASPSSAFSIFLILDTSKILAESIIHHNLPDYQTLWKKQYLDIYIKYLALKYDNYHNSKISEWFKQNPTKEKLLELYTKYPYVIEEIFNCKKNINVPKEIKDLFPRRTVLTKLYYYLYLKLRYALST